MNATDPFHNPLAGVTQMVVGLAFDLVNNSLVLIRKNRPQWMAGQLNGVGGKVQPGEAPLQAMVREFLEETGVPTESAWWLLFHREIRLDGPELFFFCAHLDSIAVWAKTQTDEEIVVLDLARWKNGFYARLPMVYNLHFLIPMGLCYLQHPQHRYRL